MSQTSDVPELVPARMVNEFAYCPRLFHIEWVQRLFADNEFTVDGRWQHRSVDEEAPCSQGDDGLAVIRSLMLSSEKLGLVGKADLVEPDANSEQVPGSEPSVVPVDFKRGSPPDIPEGAYEPERVQLCVLGMLLQEAGYHCDHGIIWFAESRRRVRIDFDQSLVTRTQELLADLREVAADPKPPPPFVDSSKCNGCSLTGICLPDETNMLVGRRTRPPRRLLPNDPGSQPLYVTEPGAYVGRKGERIHISKRGEELGDTRLIDVSQVCLFGNVQLSSQLLRELIAREIPVVWFSTGGWFQGLTTGMPTGNIQLRCRQFSRAEADPLPIARRMIEGKIRNSRTLLRRNSRETHQRALDSLASLASAAANAGSIGSLLGHEGTAARMFFARFPGLLRPAKDLPGCPFSFEGRRRRPPPDAVNCLLSYSYSLLTKDCAATLIAVGFDPLLGFLHRPRFGRPALALDLAEEFRPLIAESTVITVVNNGEVAPTDFVVRGKGVMLTQKGRRAVLRAYERRLRSEVTHPIFGYRVTYRRALEVQARLLGALLMDEIDEYTPFTTR